MSLSPSRPNARVNENWVDSYLYHRFKDSRTEAKNTLLVVVILVTTAAYQSALTPPGGIWQDDYTPADAASNSTSPPAPPPAYSSSSSNNTTNKQKAHTAGRAVIATTSTNGGYTVFVICNVVAFYTSIFMIYQLTLHSPLMVEFQIAMIAFSINYTICIVATVPPTEYPQLRLFCIVGPAVFGALMIFIQIRYFCRKIWGCKSSTSSSSI